MGEPLPVVDRPAADPPRAHIISDFLSNPNARVRLSQDKWLPREDWPRALTDLHPEVALVCVARLAMPSASHEEMARALTEMVGVPFDEDAIGKACKAAGFEAARMELASLSRGEGESLLDLSTDKIAREFVRMCTQGSANDRVKLDGCIAFLKGRGLLKGDTVLLPVGTEERKRIGKSIAELMAMAPAGNGHDAD